jgi:pyrimidine operon attenuation protein/uracil phosphoribosyltransferase
MIATDTQIIDREQMARMLKRLAHEILEQHQTTQDVLLVGIERRGVQLAMRLRAELAAIGDGEPQLATLDATEYRDDRPRTEHYNGAALTSVDHPLAIDGAQVIVVDDVLFTGRTFRAALDALMDAGRPAKVELLVMIDRGHREIPVRATYVGKNVPTSLEERIAVKVGEVDGEDGVWIEKL